jgi:hypothetical protein
MKGIANHRASESCLDELQIEFLVTFETEINNMSYLFRYMTSFVYVPENAHTGIDEP